MQLKVEKSRHKIKLFHPIQLKLYTKESRNQYKSTIARLSFYKCFFLKIVQNAVFKELCRALVCCTFFDLRRIQRIHKKGRRLLSSKNTFLMFFQERRKGK